MAKLLKKLMYYCLKVFIFSVIISVLWVLLYRFVNPPVSMFMLSDWLQSDKNIQYQWRDLDEISVFIPLAFISSEDQRFLEHNGFDIIAIEKAYKGIKSGERFRGGSTISQQLAKNLFLYKNQSIFRKGIEAYFTVLIEFFWTKERIMEIYLNVVEMGESIYGVPAAADLFFAKKVKEINQQDASLMATALPNPKRYQLSQPSAYMRKRSIWVQKQMNNLGGVSILEKWYE